MVMRSPAAKAGIEIGDVVLEVDGTEVNDPDGFGYRFATKGVKGKTPVTILRHGKKTTVDVALVTAPEDPPRDERIIEGPSPLAGVRAVNISPAVAEELRLDTIMPDETGVVVAEVLDNSPAQAFGVKRGDIVLSIDDEAVSSTRDLEKMTSRRQRLWTVSVNRNGRVLTSTVGG